MQIIRNTNQPTPPLALTIGNFDGVHLGHKSIIDKLRQISAEQNLPSAILAFEPHPVCFFAPNKSRDFRLTNLAQKLRIFRQEKIDYAIILPFNQKIAQMEAPDFVQKILVETFSVKHLVIGYDFIFGKNRQGNLQLLENEAQKHNFSISNLAAHKENEQICSSSLIRGLLQNGEIKQANHFLGRNFLIEGIVVDGKKLAREIGFPTANVKVRSQIIKPKYGVYKAEIHIPHLARRFFAVMNFGVKPTLASLEIKEPLYEVHLFDFDEKIYGPLYGKKLEIELLDFIREEKKFQTLDALKQQIKIDAALALA